MSRRNRRLLVLLVLALLAGYWLLPIRGSVILGDHAPTSGWPRIWTEPAVPRPGEPLTVYVQDTAPWTDVALLAGDHLVERDTTYAPGADPWTWRWHTTLPAANAAITFYHSCATGCIQRGQQTFGPPPTPTPLRQPTKLGAVFADPARNWHNKAAWTVDLTVSVRADEADWGVDALAERVAQSHASGLRVLVRVVYDFGQSLPPADDEVALSRYLAYCARLARDARLRDVYGYIIGGGFNSAGENSLAPEQPATPAWVARVLVGAGLPADRSDNVVQQMHAIAPSVRVLVGPVRPWLNDQSGSVPDSLDQPWLNYFNTLVFHLDATIREKSAAGIPLAAPDGFALNAFGRPEALPDQPGQEPATDLRQPAWGAAQAGFRVYRDWLRIINRYPATSGLPAFISAANTYTPDTRIVPLQNYPAGWLTAALDEINAEPQVQALCWFVDLPFGETWQEWSLAAPQGNLYAAAAEFDQLLQR
ncbi:MAG: hypothetical protein H0T53_00580 [Herpetosiphonaceae bacterium]|nr:hypothetical protein [Herpetosiphonaceae bacterium]